MTKRAALVESIEQIAEYHGRSGKEADCGGAIIEVLERHDARGHNVTGLLDLLSRRYWMHYAAGVKHPEEASDVTLRRWREEETSPFERITD